jgi:hypothetical protein
MFQKIIAFIISLTIAITGIMQPVYAAPSDLNAKPTSFPITINNRGDNNLVYFHNSFNEPGDKTTTSASQTSSDEFVGGVVNGILTTAGVAVGVTAACYIIDGVASAFFPPAAVLAAGCPGAGAMAGGAKVLIK